MGFTIPNADQVSYAPIAREFSSDLAIQEAGNEGYYVRSGCQLVAGTTSGTVKVQAGTVVVAGNEIAVAAQDNVACAASANGSNPLWILYELDSSGTIQANIGTAAANPEPNAPTASRTVIAAVFVPTSATGAATATLSSSSAAPIMVDKRITQAAPAFLVASDPTGTTLTNATSLTSVLTSTVTLPANSLVGGDVIVLAGCVRYLNSQNASTIEIQGLFGSVTLFDWTTVSLAANASARAIPFWVQVGVAPPSGIDIGGHLTVSAAGNGADADTYGFATAGLPTITNSQVIDLKCKVTTSSSTSTFGLRGFSIVKYPA